MGLTRTWPTSVAGRAAVSLVCLLAVSGCAGGYGVTHRVKPGENLYRIGQAYGYDHLELARINRIGPPYTLRVGDEIFIPGADRQLPVGLITRSLADRCRAASRTGALGSAPQRRSPS